MEKESVIVLDFGGQYNQLIARRVRECNVYCEVKPYTMSLEEIKKINPKGIIFTGGPNSVYDEKSPHYDKAIFELGIPILGICYGSQLMAWSLGGTVETAPTSEYGHTEVEVDTEDALFEGVSKTTVCWMSHTDYIAKAPQGFRVTAHTPVCPGSRNVLPREKALCNTVPSRSYAYSRGYEDALKLRIQGLWMSRRLENVILCRDNNCTAS